MLLIASAKSRSLREAFDQSVFMEVEYVQS